MKEGGIFFFRRVGAGEERRMFARPGSVNEDFVSLGEARNRRDCSGVRGAGEMERIPFPLHGRAGGVKGGWFLFIVLQIKVF